MALEQLDLVFVTLKTLQLHHGSFSRSEMLIPTIRSRFGLGLGLVLRLGSRFRFGLRLRLELELGLGLEFGLTTGVGVGVAVRVSVRVGVGVGVRIRIEARVRDMVEAGDMVGDRDRVRVWFGVRARVGVWVGRSFQPFQHRQFWCPWTKYTLQK